jgi:hypothetical protein
MKIIKSTIGLFLAASLIFAAGCGKKDTPNEAGKSAPKTITMGTQDGNKYTNDYFGLELNVPEGWTIASEEEKAALFQASQDVIEEKNKYLAKKMDLSKEQTLNLMFAFKYPLTHQGINPSVFCMAENLGLLGKATVKSGKDYLAMVKSSMEQTGMPYTFGDVITEKLDNKDFDVMEASISAGDIKVTQKYYAAIFDDYALTFIETYSNEEEASDTKSLMDTVIFK